MATPETVNDSPTGHHSHTLVVDEGDRCPWCNQPVSRADYNRIREEPILAKSFASRNSASSSSSPAPTASCTSAKSPNTASATFATS